MNRRLGLRRAAGTVGAAVVLGAAVFALPASAAAIGPPVVDDGALGAALAISGRPAPLEPTEQRSVCAEPILTGAPPVEPPLAQAVLDLPTAWQFSRGAGQKVAVIDTGVNRHPRLRALQAGGDYVADTDGTVDCDGHGTLVAGIIAAAPSPDDAFAGVAPDAEILAIRQLSLAYEPKDRRSGEQSGAITTSGYGNVLTLAGAVVRAVDMGATVINISEVACSAAGATPEDAALGAAVKYAFDRNVVVVAAAGNLTSEGACKTQNERPGWSSVQTVASPAWFDPYVLSVASIDPDGMVSELSLHGPWVRAAAIGRRIVSLDSKPGGTGLVDGVQTSEGISPIEGTSFAAPYVSGLVALVRARFPELNAAQVIDRVVRTAHAPGTGRDDKLGHGLIDPVAALTAELPDQPVHAGADTPRPLAEPARPPGPDPLPRRVAVIGSITSLAVLGVGAALSIPFRNRRELDLDHLDREVLDREVTEG
ncbi:type VII secretion-associated serine protease mycosin [Nocardia farcinica]|uniref:type VII secretion-associated serine protease mycosin n=1 Tax=Nocardia farcinica TaxID=37329 RepID=UPI0018963841|nr:type VII secretion-associated serine protease mycosin [Nocardia farcinica]MBF6268395.1 type VII secretion-associated serine protease mycosin [Nocardia farcinica]MBF6361248.1 type VII secretion-associated serine protease mycosin [Nocardia farcinica]MCZ9327793.1 type VII secretion-associated serine protease mycosin [Nocardia farcinica]